MGLQPLILFSDHLFSFFAHLPVEPKFFLLATSPIILEHQWDPPFLQALPLCHIKNYGNCPPLKVCGNLFVQGSLVLYIWPSASGHDFRRAVSTAPIDTRPLGPEGYPQRLKLSVYAGRICGTPECVPLRGQIIYTINRTMY